MLEKIFKDVRARFAEMKKRILELLTEGGILVDPAAVNLLCTLPDPIGCVKHILKDPDNRPLILSKEDVEQYAHCVSEKTIAEPRKVSEPKKKTAAVETTVKKHEVIVVRDITGDSTCVGNVIDFAKLFNDRYSTIRKMLYRRRELAGIVSISRAKKVQRDIKIVGMVNEIRTTKNGHTLLEIEDEADKIQILIMKGSRKIKEAFLKDEVVGVIGSFSKDGEIIIAKEIIRPDVPMNSAMIPNGSDSVVAFVSDIHVGSDTFLPEKWNRFLEWLNKDPSAKKIRYMVMPGDLVDGIGIYPGQEDELLIEDVFAQYEALSKLIEPIPDWIKIVMMPGNHDAVRLAEPQPALSKEIQNIFDSRVMFAGNPCYLEIEGRSILAYHGRSMDDFIASVPSLSYSAPLDAMKEMLKRRHLAPVYGERTAIAPEQKDYMIIDRVPNIFVTGHVHSCGVSEYRGIKLINASTWQSQTEFQRMHNVVPDPARVPMINLGTGESWIEDFSY